MSFLPALLVLYLGFGRYDGRFKDNVVFLHFMGGLGLGALLALAALIFFAIQPIAFVIGFALLAEVTKTAVLNRKKWAGDRHVIFNGSALGAGVGVMLAFAFGTRTVHEAALRPTLDLALLAIGLVLVHFTTGAYVARGVHARNPIVATLLAAGLSLVVTLALEEWYRGVVQGGGYVLLWPIVAAAAGVSAFVYARLKLLPEGLDPESRKAMRRDERKERAAE